MNEHDIGDVVRLSIVFTVGGTATDPTAVSLKVKDPGGTVVTYTYPATIVKATTGNYHQDISPTTAGHWKYRWESTGVAQAAEEGEFYVKTSRVL